VSCHAMMNEAVRMTAMELMNMESRLANLLMQVLFKLFPPNPFSQMQNIHIIVPKLTPESVT